jgi:two-component system, NarL family, sensor kinase
MRRFPWISVLLLFSAGVYSQDMPADTRVLEKKIAYFSTKIDSLPYFISAGQTSTFTGNCFLPEHKMYFLGGTNMGFSLYALHVAGPARAAYLQMYALSQFATDLYLRQDYEASGRCWQKALALAMENRFDCEELHNYRPALNNNCFLTGDYTGAMKISTEGLEKAEKVQDKERAAHFNNVIGYIHMKQGNFTESRQYFTRYLQQTREMRNKSLEAHALANLGDLATTENNYTEAIRFFRQSLDTYKTLYAGFNVDPKEREAYLSDKLAEIFKRMADYKTALQYDLAAIALTRQASCNEYDIARYYINTGAVYNRLLHPDSALVYLREGLSIVQRIKYREELRNVYEQLAVSFALTRRFDSAYHYQGLFARLKDSITSENSNREILQREANLQITQQKRLQQVELARQQLWRNIIIGIALVVILIVILLYNRYRIRQKMEYQQQLNRQQNEMFNLAVSVQEKERKRIAEDIHDSLGSVLSAAKLKLSTLEEEMPLSTEGQREKYQTTLALLDEAAAELRNISHNIMPATLSKLGLIAALKNLVDKISSHSGLEVQFEAHELESRIEESAEISIYRIVLELLNNIVKHAGAAKATIQLIRYPDYINITVEDDGNGFDHKSIPEGKGIGLGNILSRVEYLKGRIDIDSAPGRGTTVIIDIPYTT